MSGASAGEELHHDQRRGHGHHHRDETGERTDLHARRDGEPGDFFCFLADGELKVSKNGKTLNILGEGDCFGEMAVINQHAHTRGADVTAFTHAKIITISGEALKRASSTCRMRFYEAFLQVLASRLTLANQRMSAF